MPRAKKERKPKMEGVPDSDLLKDAATKWPKVLCRIKRNTRMGRWASVGQWTYEVMNIANIEADIKEIAGGGRFRVEPVNPSDASQYADPLVPFEFEIEGLPKPVQPAEYGTPGGGNAPYVPEQAMYNYPAQQYTAPAPSPAGPQPPQQGPSIYNNPALVPPYARTMPPHMQAAAAGAGPDGSFPNAGRFTGGQVWANTPDTIAMQQLESAKRELERERRQHEETRKAMEAERAERLREMEKLREDMREQRAENERRQFQMQIEALKQQQQQPQQKQWDTEGIAKLVAAGAPILSAMVQANSQKASALAESSTKASEKQFEGYSKMVEAMLSQKKEDPMKGFKEIITAIAPAVMPAISELITSKTPQEQAALYSSLAENNLTTMTMMSQFIGEMAERTGGKDEWWYPLVQNTAESVKMIAEQMAAGQTKIMGGGAPQQPHQQQEDQTTEGQRIAAQIANIPAFPGELKTEPMLQIIAALHDRMEAPAVADFTAQHLLELSAAGRLPPMLSDALSNPVPALSRLVEPLPIYTQDQAYVMDVLRRTAARMRELQPQQTQRAREQAAHAAQGIQPPVDTQAEPVERHKPAEIPEKANGTEELDATGSVPFSVGDAFGQQREREPVPVG